MRDFSRVRAGRRGIVRTEQAESAGLALLVPGGRGQLGSDLARQGAALGSVAAPGSAELDITDATAVMAAVAELAASAKDAGQCPVVVNAAAYTAVDNAETDEAGARRVNVAG